jgi:hypothetical protein
VRLYCTIPNVEYDEGCEIIGVVLGETPEMECDPTHPSEVVKLGLVDCEEIKHNKGPPYQVVCA